MDTLKIYFKIYYSAESVSTNIFFKLMNCSKTNDVKLTLKVEILKMPGIPN
jgi:hypothetical protein